MWAALWLACGSDPRPAPVEAQAAGVIDLRRHPFAALRIPADSLGGREAPTARIPLDDGWRYAGRSRAGAQEYTQPVPIRPRGLFFFRETPGVRLVNAAGEPVPYRIGGGNGEVTWSYDRDRVRLFLPADADAPTDDAWFLDSPLALGREERLHRRLAEVGSDEEFVRARISEGIASRSGLLLPAPALAAWDVTLPPAAELVFTPGLVPPEVAVGPKSDGAELRIAVTAGGVTTEVWRGPLPTTDFPVRRLDLSRWSGQAVRLEAETLPGATADGDVAFLGEPAIASRQRDPRKVVFVFVDTVRVDHLSLYGYERDTSAAIDHLAAEASVFTQARSVAPWTLPSARSVLTGRYPDRWRHSQTLQATLSEAGFATAFVAGNVYLTSNFGMDRDFDYHQEDGLFPSAESTTDDALAWLDAHDGRDVFLQVHYMSAHLPYQEPVAYRYRYAGAAPDGLPDGFELGDVRRSKAANDPDLQQYVKDRYDNNIRYATDQIRRLVDRLDANDILVLYADHGEEFWEHRGYEHGHTLFDELLRVPLVIRAPGMPAGPVETPVSLLDVAPTVLDLLGQPVPAEMDGRSLARIGTEPPPADRALGFGWPLYGTERWGVLTGAEKWTTTEGREALFDVIADPAERKNLLGREPGDRGLPYRERLSRALGRPMVLAWRLTNTHWKGPPPKAPPLWALCSAPGGFAEAWVGDDPLDNMHATVQPISRTRAGELLSAYQIADHPLAEDAGAVELCWEGGFNGPREVYVLPARPLAEVGGSVICSAYQGDASGGTRGTMRGEPDRDPAGATRAPIGKLSFGPNRALHWQYGVAPVPSAETESLDGRDAEVDAMLSMLGYVDKDATDTRGRACQPPAPQPGAPAGG
jgi:arylsulfatase A-like enzyme